MKVVNISLDPKILDKDTPATERARGYGQAVELYTVIVPTPARVTVELSDTTTIHGVSGPNKLFQLYNIYRLLSRLAKEGKCDVISSTDIYYIGFVSLLVARRYHLGLEISVLGIEKLSALRLRVASFVLKRASVVRALSHRLKNRLVSEFGAEESKIHVIPIHVPIDTLGLDVRTFDDQSAAVFDRLRSDFKETYGACFNFLTVSRVLPLKRIELQIKALAIIAGDHPEARLHVVGDGPYVDELQSIAVSAGVADQIIFHGRKTGLDLGVFYLECDCFMLTSDYEGWGMVVVEAATAGLPIIMTDVGCAEEFIVDEESGLVVPINDTEAIAAAMKRIATETTLRQKLSLGTKHALDSLESFDTIITRYVANWEIAHQHKL